MSMPARPKTMLQRLVVSVVAIGAGIWVTVKTSPAPIFRYQEFDEDEIVKRKQEGKWLSIRIEDPTPEQVASKKVYEQNVLEEQKRQYIKRWVNGIIEEKRNEERMIARQMPKVLRKMARERKERESKAVDDMTSST
ncbi:uncharacterized protein KQ657_003776 [Scheffersomyces spartinae]|uniref:Uncharacterized protein n=1 Tax=Scheffersomyces spartinae TaxID=45513 RepID=A0A9P7VCL3_9ASCO|nr:uncharacterized protein KQ657_003776 [Scheffersomyces spartinae]KAG7195250.1 hypothetical protein KQ657_003776 [Scheffersomyces spartinae]